MSVANHDQATVLIFAARYALGRRTYGPSVVKSQLVHQQECLQSQDYDTLIRDIEQYGRDHDGYGGGDLDQTWLDALDWLREMRSILHRRALEAADSA